MRFSFLTSTALFIFLITFFAVNCFDLDNSYGHANNKPLVYAYKFDLKFPNTVNPYQVTIGIGLESSEAFFNSVIDFIIYYGAKNNQVNLQDKNKDLREVYVRTCLTPGEIRNMLDAASSYASKKPPHASIVSWKQDIVASGEMLAQCSWLKEKQELMPMCVTIFFDQEPSLDFVEKFFRFIKHESFSEGRQNNKEFIVKVPHGTLKSEFQKILDQANNHFDSDFKKQNEMVDVLHRAILNNSSVEVKDALRAGAKINSEKGGLSPLAVAALMDKFTAAKVLVDVGANVNITYQEQPLVLYLINREKLNLALLFLKNGINLSDNKAAAEKTIDYLLYHRPNPLNEQILEILQLLGYDIKSNFESADLSKNKWYLALQKYPKDCNGRNTGFLDPNLIQLLLKYGANPNQVFISDDGTSKTPLLLIILDICKRRCEHVSKSHLMQTFSITLDVLLNAGADINQTASQDGRTFSPLTNALLTMADDIGEYIIDCLVKKGACIEQAIELFIKNGYTIQNHKIKLPGNPPISLLLWALLNNNLNAVKQLVNAGAYLNESSPPLSQSLYPELCEKNKHFTPLKVALLMGNDEMISFLVKHGATT